MQRRDYSTNKLPKIPTNDSSLSSKLYSVTGLRIFQAKFMEELRYPRPQLKISPPVQASNQNFTQTVPIKPMTMHEGFTGKDRANESKLQKGREADLRSKQQKKEETLLKTRQGERVKVLNGRPRGLRNLGNTCYMNAVLQSLLALQDFNTALDKEIKTRKQEKGLAVAYSKVVGSYRSCGEKEVLNPSQFKSIIGKRKDRFAGNSQQDSQQFLTAFLEGINEEITRVKVKPKYKELQGDLSKNSLKNLATQWWEYNKERDDSIICDYFQGQMQSMILCSDCNFKSVSFDNFWGLPISLSQQKSNNLSDLITSSFRTENRLEDYSCQKCKKAKTCSKVSKIFRLPIILVVQLKRFGYGMSRKQKIKDRVIVPHKLDLKDVMSNETTEVDMSYGLKSTIQHSGELNFGHYTGHVYSSKEEKWYNADDDYVSEENVDNTAPQLYVLFYEKK